MGPEIPDRFNRQWKAQRMVRRKIRTLRCKRASRSKKSYSSPDERGRTVAARWLARLSVTASGGTDKQRRPETVLHEYTGRRLDSARAVGSEGQSRFCR